MGEMPVTSEGDREDWMEDDGVEAYSNVEKCLMSREWELSSSSDRSTLFRLKPTGQARSCWVSTMSTGERGR